MRKITHLQILVFLFLLGVIAFAGIASSVALNNLIDTGCYRSLLVVVLGLVFTFMFGIIEYRVFQYLFPLRPGEIAPGSMQEFIYHIYVLHFMLLFYPVMRSYILPIPFTSALYRALGARIGVNSFTGGIIHDPLFVEIGSNTLLGQSSLLVPHIIENGRLAHYPICIGSNVTVGAQAIILADVIIGDKALVAAGAVVTKGSRIGLGERWGGIPAKRIGG